VAEGPSLGTQVNRGVAWAAVAQAVIAISDGISQMIVVALLITADDYGIAQAAMAYYVLLDYAADFGVTSAIIQRDDLTEERISTVFWFNVMVSGGLFALLWVIGPVYGWILDNPTIGWLLVAYGGKLVFQNVYAIPFALLRKELRFGDIAKARMAAHLLESVARVAFAAMGLTVWCWVLAALVRSTSFGIIIQARHPFIPKLVFKPKEIIPHIKFGLRSAASQILYQFYTNIDYSIVTYAFGTRANGLYSLAYLIVLEPVKTIANVVIDVAFPAFARMRNDRAQLIKQFIAFTRLNLIAVLPYVVIVMLIIPEALHIFLGRSKWTYDEIELCATAARMLCMVGVLRALGFIGPPLLDGIGRPDLTLRYMVSATIVVPSMFLLGAFVLGPQFTVESETRGLLAVAIAWAVGYPLAFAVLGWIVVKTIEVPLGEYLKACWGMVGCCAAGALAGLGVSIAMAGLPDLARLFAVGGSALAVMIFLLVTWQKITPRSIKAAIKG
jgi:O-antigen/teichoic acid export membrane protein